MPNLEGGASRAMTAQWLRCTLIWANASTGRRWPTADSPMRKILRGAHPSAQTSPLDHHHRHCQPRVLCAHIPLSPSPNTLHDKRLKFSLRRQIHFHPVDSSSCCFESYPAHARALGFLFEASNRQSCVFPSSSYKGCPILGMQLFFFLAPWPLKPPGLPSRSTHRP